MCLEGLGKLCSKRPVLCYASKCWECNYYALKLCSYYVMVISLCPLTQSTWVDYGGEFVDSKLASEAENTLTVSRPNLLVTSMSKKSHWRA